MSEQIDPPSDATDGTDSPHRSEPFASTTPPRRSGMRSDGSVTEPSERKSPPKASPTPTGTTGDGRRLLAAFAWGSPFTALVAAVEALVATVLLGVPVTAAPAVVALVAFAVYSIDHVADADADAASTPDRALLARRYGHGDVGVAFSIAYLAHLPADVLYPVVLGRGVNLGYLFWPFVEIPPSQTDAVTGYVLELAIQFLVFLRTPRGAVFVSLELALLLGAILVWRWDGWPGVTTIFDAIDPRPVLR